MKQLKTTKNPRMSLQYHGFRSTDWAGKQSKVPPFPSEIRSESLEGRPRQVTCDSKFPPKFKLNKNLRNFKNIYTET